MVHGMKCVMQVCVSVPEFVDVEKTYCLLKSVEDIPTSHSIYNLMITYLLADTISTL